MNATETVVLRARADAVEKWPALRPNLESFSVRITAMVEGGEVSSAELETLALADLLLSASCLAGEPSALAILEREVFPKVAAAITRVDPSPAFVDEALQQVRERVLVGTRGGPARLADYGGRGALVKWLGAVALRVALNMKAPAREDVALEETLADALRASSADPEFAALKGQLREDLAASLRTAIAELPSEDRLLLRLHLVDGLTIDKLDRVMGIHRSTVARKVATARQALVANVRREMTKRAGVLVSRDEMQRMAALVQSQLDLSIGRLLGE